MSHSLPQYPYIPAHITKPKEHKKLFLVQLQEKGRMKCILFTRCTLSKKRLYSLTCVLCVFSIVCCAEELQAGGCPLV